MLSIPCVTICMANIISSASARGDERLDVRVHCMMRQTSIVIFFSLLVRIHVHVNCPPKIGRPGHDNNLLVLLDRIHVHVNCPLKLGPPRPPGQLLPLRPIVAFGFGRGRGAMVHGKFSRSRRCTQKYQCSSGS